MKTNNEKKIGRCEVLVAALAFAGVAFADPATGWLQTAAGTYDFGDTANWVNGEVNGVFGADLTLAGNQTITFSADTTLAGGLTISYAGNYTMTFQSDGTGAKTLTLGGDITESLQGNASAVVTIGGDEENALVLDLGGGNRTISASATVSDVGKSGILSIPAVIQNGALTIAGGKKLKLSGANTYSGGTTIAGTTYLHINSETALGTGDVCINEALNLCADGNLTMTANNRFFMNASSFAYRSAKALDIGTGDFIATNSFQFWAEGDTLTIHGQIRDQDGVPSAWKLQKWGSKTLNTYSDAQMTSDATFTLGNGTWNFYGVISGQNPKVEGSTNWTPFNLYGANTFTGTMEVSGGSVCAYLRNAMAIPDGAMVKVISPAVVAGYTQKANEVLSSGKIDKESTGTLALSVNETADFDLTEYPDLTLGAVGNATLTGTLAANPDGVLRLGGGGKSLTLATENALPDSGTIEIRGNNVILAQSNDFAGTIRIMNGNCLELKGETTAIPNADVQVMGGTFYINSNAGEGCRRAGTVHLHGGIFQYAGNKSTETFDSIDKLILDIRDFQYGVLGGVCHMNLYANGKTAHLNVGELERRHDMVWRMTGNASSNRLRIGGATGENTVQFTVGDGSGVLSELVGGGGAAGTTTISVYPFGFAACGTYYDSLLTYDVSTGFRALDYETEYATTITPGTVSQDNVRLAVGSTTGITLDTTVNSVFMQGSDSNQGNTTINGSGKLALTSGVLVMGYHRNASPNVNVPVDFGSRQGVICFGRGKNAYWRGALHGTAGAIFFQTSDSAATGSGGTGLLMYADEGTTLADSDITGDIIVHGKLFTGCQTVFPGGAERSGDIYAYGYFEAAGTFNGMNGIGMFWLKKNTITLGADGSAGDSEGGLYDQTKLVKTGAGRQRIGGISTHWDTTTVSQGTLQMDGAFSNSVVTVAEGATLAGCGTFCRPVTVADGARLEAGSEAKGTDDPDMNFDAGLTLAGNAQMTFMALDQTNVTSIAASSIAGEGMVTVNLDSSNLKSGDYLLVKSDSAIPFGYSRGPRCGKLSLRNDGKELWMTVHRGLYILVQ